MGLFSNPELLRNLRAQLRWGRMLAIASICAAVSLVFGYSFAESSKNAPPREWGMNLLQIMLLFQIIILLIGGGIACLLSIQREKDLNTFDFQRVTRLTPLELALGKLFGAPAVTYFAALCLMPAALVGAFVGRARPSFVFTAYVVLFLGSVVFHAFALMVSLQIERNASAGAIILFLFLVQFTSISDFGFLSLCQFNAFYALDLVKMTSWQLDAVPTGYSMWGSTIAAPVDVFFGWRVHHVPVLLVLYLTFTAWFLLATVRNIKRDPSIHEVFTPGQALGFALYINLILIGFFRWDQMAPMSAHSTLLGFNLALFFALGLVLLRNRERLRRLLRRGGEAAANWLSMSWPSPHVLLGLALAGAASIVAVHKGRDPKQELDLGLVVFRTGFLALWVVRDILFLQWMNLRRGRRQVVLGVLYLLIYYMCAGILFAALDLYDTARGSAIAGAFLPSVALDLSVARWTEAANLWTVAVAAQLAVCAFFIGLQRRRLREFLMPAGSAVTSD
jgi:hypothetical protein